MKRIIIALAILILILAIPVIIIFSQKKIGIITTNIFLGNLEKNPQAQDCKLVFPVQRKIKKTEQIARATLEELLKGPTAEEKTQGYFSSINDGVKINNISLKDKILQVDFDERLEEGIGGSCKVALIRSQITETLKQFPTVSKVMISINGRTEDILQP
jgi:spore germination protein GerM